MTFLGTTAFEIDFSSKTISLPYNITVSAVMQQMTLNLTFYFNDSLICCNFQAELPLNKFAWMMWEGNTLKFGFQENFGAKDLQFDIGDVQNTLVHFKASGGTWQTQDSKLDTIMLFCSLSIYHGFNPLSFTISHIHVHGK